MEEKAPKRALRFKPDQGAFAKIGTSIKDGNVVIQRAALVLNESYTGLGLVAKVSDQFKIGEETFVQVEPAGPMKCKIVWVKPVDDEIVRFGVEYLD